MGVPLVPVKSAADLHNSPQYRHRGFFQDVNHPVLGTAAYPTVPYLLSASPARITSAAPTLGQHTAEISDSIDTPRPVPTVKSAQLKPPKVSRGGPLEGVRVVELTKVWAGPYAGKLLAFLGAEVIKVETSCNPEEMRAYGGTDINHAPFFLSINPEILSVELDIKSADGMDRLRELIAHSDIVINNLRPGAMERLGLGYQQLTSIKPDIISVSIKMWGNDGPLGHQTGYAPCFAALAGLASLVGYPGGPPLGTSMRYGDSTVGAAAALRRRGRIAASRPQRRRPIRRRVGRGDPVVDDRRLPARTESHRKATSALMATTIPICARTTAIRARTAPGSALPWPTTGSGAHCATSSTPPRSPMTRATPACRTRRQHADALDADLARFTRSHDAEQLAQRLRVGGCAGEQERDIPRRDRRSTALGPRVVSLRQRSSRRPTADPGSVVANVGCSGARSRAVLPTSARTTTMFCTRSSRRPCDGRQDMTATLAGTAALVTGASSGIGAATAKALAAAGRCGRPAGPPRRSAGPS